MGKTNNTYTGFVYVIKDCLGTVIKVFAHMFQDMEV